MEDTQRWSLEVVSAMLSDVSKLRTPGPLVLVIDGVDDFNDGANKFSVEVLPLRFPGRLSVVYTCGTFVFGGSWGLCSCGLGVFVVFFALFYFLFLPIDCRRFIRVQRTVKARTPSCARPRRCAIAFA